MNINNISEHSYLPTENNIQNSFEKLSSGKEINKASDGPSTLVDINRVAAMISSNIKQVQNEQTSISMNNTADAGYSQINNNLQQIRELAVQSQNGTYGSTEKEAIQGQIDKLADNTRKIIDNTNFGNQNLITEGDKLKEVLKGASTDMSTKQIDAAINEVSSQQANVGAKTQESQSTINSRLNEIDSQQSSLSVLQNIDTAKGVMNLLRDQLQIQTSISSMKNLMHINKDKIERLLG
ncbi:MAG TPA: hypothetical protein DF296_14660 [Candidatus Margulisbacteria bacterium]|nr:MAG: hypothetical protein A2X43_03340 [Candidatus Margulisbacteria bacterium GWD2_39_127]OGI02009.1 MAG: hypothetical protein A2X42_09010 [Candidatus Margulisbacteria bacterium GWF2_38_17]OGI11404.1 MAG: hypothetical protein A2X41_12145 [Candidatus Margulisbacteria bacterium GWE2_39_32]HAR62456.1 hypothetical protein [Candidatus Margulisiibacteriota bacterium]HCT86430.1 hypothetical protein [Candidatus Margulisiibacteriota bacterium]